jgi:hypothetical protein
MISESDKPVEFKITGEQFIAIAPAMCPANVELKYMELVSIGSLTTAHRNLINDLLEEDSAQRFLARMDDKKNPITLNTLGEVAKWLIETYSGNVMG